MINLDEWYKEDESIEPETDVHYPLIVNFLERKGTEKSKSLLKQIINCKNRREFRELYWNLQFESMLQVS